MKLFTASQLTVAVVLVTAVVQGLPLDIQESGTSSDINIPHLFYRQPQLYERQDIENRGLGFLSFLDPVLNIGKSLIKGVLSPSDSGGTEEKEYHPHEHEHDAPRSKGKKKKGKGKGFFKSVVGALLGSN
ncbi:hypothetical protein CVT24_007831 [Panaeolus cyanescens]|uniref:Uncharacterized protein n=1 Tax=Panaeolus cyanescens TaxID=181874 RepID=A0A409VZJ5_9AGAR|nr:hypothetical protein CVT24_007831 [Panaeolus cyanescens]